MVRPMHFTEDILTTPVKITNVMQNADGYCIPEFLEQILQDVANTRDSIETIAPHHFIDVLHQFTENTRLHALLVLARPLANVIRIQYNNRSERLDEIDDVLAAKQVGYTAEAHEDIVYARTVHILHIALGIRQRIRTAIADNSIEQAEMGHNIAILSQHIPVTFPDTHTTAALETELTSLALQTCSEVIKKLNAWTMDKKNKMTYGEFLQYKHTQLPTDQKFLEAHHLYAIRKVSEALDTILCEDHPIFYEYLQRKWQSDGSCATFVEYLEDMVQTAKIIQIENPVVSIETL
jgi:hypothetical protein